MFLRVYYGTGISERLLALSNKVRPEAGKDCSRRVTRGAVVAGVGGDDGDACEPG